MFSFCFFFVSCFSFLSFVSFFLSFSLSSFKVNLKVHHRNWRVVLLLAPTRGKKKKTKENKLSAWPEAAPAPVSLRKIRLLPNSFEYKNCLINIRLSLRALQWFLHFSGSVKFFDKAILSGSVSHSKSIYRTTFF